MSITEAAKKSNGNSRKCSSCPLVQKLPFRCTPEIAKICSESHIEGFKKGAKFQKENNIERKVVQFLDAKYGREKYSRIVKLNEELDELKQALVFQLADYDNIDDIIDEMSDVVAVTAHLCNILGTDIEKLLKQAYDKVKKREKNPDYKRNHPHE